MRKFPNALVVMLAFIIFASILTYIIPHGQYDRVHDPIANYDKVVPGSFKVIEAEPISIFNTLLTIPEGIISRADLIALVLLIGGCFYVIEKTGAFREGVIYLTEKLHGKEEVALVIMSLLFATGGVLEGLQEEMIGMVPILLYFSNKLGYNAFVAVAISFGSAIIGGSFSPINPFGVAIAQKAAELPFLSGYGFRIAILLMAVAVWTFMIVRYANKNKVTIDIEEEVSKNTFSKRSIIILGLLAVAFIILVYGILKLGWGFNEMTAEFFVVGIVAGLIAGLGINGTSEAYIEGFKEMTFASIIIGLASSISIILKQGTIIDTIIFGLFTPLQYFPKGLAAISMMVSQSLLHFPVPSTSGQAILTMPVLSPLSDLIGVSRQVCVLAYQYGGMTMDLIVPSNGALMAIIAIAGISYNVWLKFVFKFVLIIMALSAIAIFIAVQIGY